MVDRQQPNGMRCGVFVLQVRLEEALGARENPAISEIQSDEGEWTGSDPDPDRKL